MKFPTMTLCDILIDQGKYIGNDPVGFACTNEAKYEINSIHICERCFDLIKLEPSRVTFISTNTPNY